MYSSACQGKPRDKMNPTPFRAPTSRCPRQQSRQVSLAHSLLFLPEGLLHKGRALTLPHFTATPVCSSVPGQSGLSQAHSKYWLRGDFTRQQGHLGSHRP